jgi:hypothetical protein
MEESMTEIKAINLGLETIKIHEAYFKRQDEKINEKINTLQEFNDLLRELAKFTSTLNAGKNNGKLDFTNHPLRPTIDKVYLKYPELFTGYESTIYANWDAKRIENVTFGADPIVKQLTSEVSQLMTKLQVDYSDQTEITRILGKIIEELNQHVKSILSKLSKITG